MAVTRVCLGCLALVAIPACAGTGLFSGRGDRTPSAFERTGPAGALFAQLASIIAAELDIGADEVGLESLFFGELCADDDLGADDDTYLAILERIEHKVGVSIPGGMPFETVRELAAYVLARASGSALKALPPAVEPARLHGVPNREVAKAGSIGIPIELPASGEPLTIVGTLLPDGPASSRGDKAYLFAGRKGQRLEVHLETSASSALFELSVLTRHGPETVPDLVHDGADWSGELPATCHYELGVLRSPPAPSDGRLREGDSVRIIDGPLTGFGGIVMSVSRDDETVTISAAVFGRETSFQLPARQMERTSNQRFRAGQVPFVLTVRTSQSP